MGRPVDHKRRKALIQDAFTILRRLGPHAITMSQLAEELGVKRSTLYFYFPDTGAILTAYIEDMLSRHRDHLVEHLGGRHHPVDFLHTWARTTLRFFLANPSDLAALVHLWTASDAARNPSLGAHLQAHTRPFFDLAVKTLRDGQARGLVAPCEPEAVVTMVTSLVEGAFLQHFTGRREPSRLLTDLWEQVLGPLRIPALPKHPPTVEHPRPTQAVQTAQAGRQASAS